MTGARADIPAVIRASTEADRAALLALYPQDFPEEDLRPLVSALLDFKAGEGITSMVSTIQQTPVAHILFTQARSSGSDEDYALLGPLCVAPACQRRGIGRTLVTEGTALLAAQGCARVFVLGDPGYYRQFGFRREDSIVPPYPAPPAWAEAWQSLPLREDGAQAGGILSLPAPWHDPALWAP
ncbi:MAG: N-acetyltransferase [Pseudomonadota bacterium]